MRPREAREPARKVRAFPDAAMPLGRNHSRIIDHSRLRRFDVIKLIVNRALRVCNVVASTPRSDRR